MSEPPEQPKRPARQPDLHPDEQRELTVHAQVPPEDLPDGPPDADVSIEPRPPIVSGLRLWWVPMVGLCIGLLFIAGDHMWRAGGTIAGSLWLAAGLRAVLPEESAGGLVVRQRWLDVTLLLLLGGLVALSAFTLDLRDLRS